MIISPLLNILSKFRTFSLMLLFVLTCAVAQASDKDFPKSPNPPRLVNDLAGTMSADQVARLEEKLVNFDKTTSTQITIVTIKNLGGYEVQSYAVELAQRWGIGQKGKDNGVLILASIDDRKINISTGYGLEGALTDATSGRIIRNEITPSFKNGNYYEGFDKGVEAIIKATKGEYKADKKAAKEERGIPLGVIIIGVIIIIIAISRGGGGGRGGGRYISGRGSRGFVEGWLIGSLLSGAGRGGSSGWGGGGGWGGGSSGGGGFGGFGGGGFGGGGASGSW